MKAIRVKAQSQRVIGVLDLVNRSQSSDVQDFIGRQKVGRVVIAYFQIVASRVLYTFSDEVRGKMTRAFEQQTIRVDLNASFISQPHSRIKFPGPVNPQ